MIGYYVVVTRTGLVIRCGSKALAMTWANEDTFEGAMGALNADGWHVSFHETLEEAVALAREGVCCHGKFYYLKESEQ